MSFVHYNTAMTGLAITMMMIMGNIFDHSLDLPAIIESVKLSVRCAIDR